MKPLKLGITGCIGSGKSVVSKILRTLGIPVYDCDSEAKRVMHTNADIRRELMENFGNECYPDGKELDRRYLAGIIFDNPQALKTINAIVHPRVKQDFEEWSIHRHCPIVAMESAIIFESGFQDTVDSIIAVYAPKETCIERAALRSGSSHEEIEKRLKNQMAPEALIQKSDYIIYNDNKDALLPQIASLLTTLKNNTRQQ